MKQNKQNVFDDFIASAEWLIEQKYTSSAKLAIRGGSMEDCWSAPCSTSVPNFSALPSLRSGSWICCGFDALRSARLDVRLRRPQEPGGFPHPGEVLAASQHPSGREATRPR